MNQIILFDLPTLPKGVMSLSLASVSSYFKKEHFRVKVVDLNFYQHPYTSLLNQLLFEENTTSLCGMKVSSQNYQIAIQLTTYIKQLCPSIKVFWGGELPSLLPDLCLQHAHTIISGLFETVADNFQNDLLSNSLKQHYKGENEGHSSAYQKPALDVDEYEKKYSLFMGLPLETSRGCTEKCAFCMVHVMQNKYFLKQPVQLNEELKKYTGHFINVVDYNIGVSPEHVISVAGLIGQSGATGWMAEMCIEMLDNDAVLAALQKSGCRMIYCGLESIEEVSLKSIHKMNTNHVENYERIIRKAQSYGVQVAAGVIVGIEGTNENTFQNLFDFYTRMGIAYVKLTFLIYNPGTKVKKYMTKKGAFVTEDIHRYDGNHLSFLPTGVNEKVVMEGASFFIRKFYSLPQIVKRSFNAKLSFTRRIEFVLFNLCYRSHYFQMLDTDFYQNDELFYKELQRKFTKPLSIRIFENLLQWLRKL